MKIPESMEVGNLQVGEIVKKYKTLIEIGIFNTTLNDEDIKCTLTKTQLQETIRDLKQLFNQLD